MEELFGRRKIFTPEERFDEENIKTIVNSALTIHFRNLSEEDYLYWYRRGRQPILEKEKDVRPEINNKVVVNIASEIVDFKNGYFLTQPTFYVSRRKDESITDDVAQLNDYLYLSGKHEADNELVDWFHTVGVGTLFVESNDDDDEPVKVYAVDPRQAFVVYSMKPGNKPVIGINMVIDTDENDKITSLRVDAFTKDKIYRLSGGAIGSVLADGKTPRGTVYKLDSVETNVLGEIPIIEYSYNSCRMGAFEKVISLLDGLNFAESNRLDSEEQFVNNLLVFYNCQLGEDENGNPITPKQIREQGAIYLKSTGQDKADVKDITAVLDESQTQVLINDMLKQICDIVGMPFSSGANTSDSSNNGAVYLRNGWGTADTAARNCEDIFKKANKQFDKIFLKILKAKDKIGDIKPSDIDIQFTRNEMDNLLIKTQGALNLKMLGLSPELVLSKSGVSNDPVGDVAKSKEYIDRAYMEQVQSTQENERNEGRKDADNGEN